MARAVADIASCEEVVRRLVMYRYYDSSPSRGGERRVIPI